MRMTWRHCEQWTCSKESPTGQGRALGARTFWSARGGAAERRSPRSTAAGLRPATLLLPTADDPYLRATSPLDVRTIPVNGSKTAITQVWSRRRNTKSVS